VHERSKLWDVLYTRVPIGLRLPKCEPVSPTRFSTRAPSSLQPSRSLPTGFLRIIFVPLVGASEALFRTRRGRQRRHALSVSDFIYLTAAFCLALNTRAFKKTGFPDLWPLSLSRVQFLAPPRPPRRVRFTRILLGCSSRVAYPASASRLRRKILRSLTINLEAARK